MRYTYFAIFIFTLGTIFGGMLLRGYQWYSKEQIGLTSRNSSFERIPSQYAFINPLLECELYPKINSTLTPFKDKLDDYISSAITEGAVSDVSLYYRDLVNGPWIGINEEKEFSPASLLKVPLMMSIFKIADSNPAFLEQGVEFQKEQDTQQAQQIPAKNPLEVGKNYTINQLLEHMIMYSDNDAALVLLHNIPQAEVYKPYTELGITEPKFGNEQYNLTVIQYASFFRVLYNATFLSREYSENALSLLSSTIYNDGIVAGVPDSVRVSHKFGERQWEGGTLQQLHDCGIVYHTSRPYILCVMTQGKDQKKMSKVIQNISKITYTEVDTQTKK